MKVEKAEFLGKLQSVSSGLMPKGIIEQGNTFVFKDGNIYTYNDEVSCLVPSGLEPSILGAVMAGPLLALLGALEEEELDVEFEKTRMLVTGKNRRANYKLQQSILLPLSNVDKPKEWKKLPEGFSEGLALVQECAGTNRKEFGLMCIHITDKWMEACDRFQMARYLCKLPVEEGLLVPKNSIKGIVQLGMTSFSVTDSWVHFRNPTKLQIACRKYADDYKDMSAYFNKEKGKQIVFPKGLVEASSRAEIFSKEDADDNKIQVEIRPDKIKIKGMGISGEYYEIKKLQYQGPNRMFRISPKILVTIVDRHTECTITDREVRADVDKFSYIAALGKVKESK